MKNEEGRKETEGRREDGNVKRGSWGKRKMRSGWRRDIKKKETSEVDEGM